MCKDIKDRTNKQGESESRSGLKTEVELGSHSELDSLLLQFGLPLLTSDSNKPRDLEIVASVSLNINKIGKNTI